MTDKLPQRTPDTGLVDKLFLAHPRTAGESYWAHLYFALATGLAMIFHALALILHGIFPFLCEKTASDYICRLYTTIAARREKCGDAVTPPHD